MGIQISPKYVSVQPFIRRQSQPATRAGMEAYEWTSRPALQLGAFGVDVYYFLNSVSVVSVIMFYVSESVLP